ncbi:MAG: glycosyl hydrolase family 28 protein, partial [Myxococcota bacterium]|nr:glycosyl hydrolase family 28 protein [Myxococcota bacterium]
ATNDAAAEAASSGAPAGGGACPADPSLPAEPKIPPACTTLQATQALSGKVLPSEASPDTQRIQSALNACGPGKAVKLTSSGANNAFLSGSLTLPSGVTLWVDAGTTLYASRSPSLLTGPLISVGGSGSGIVGDGVIDGQGGEAMIGGTQSWWEWSFSLRPSGSAPIPALIETSSGSSGFTMYRITIHNAPKFHVKLSGTGFMVWGVTLLTPSAVTNSQGKPLDPFHARNTDGIDPGASGSAKNGYIVCSKISVGDDEIAIKGGSSVDHLTIAHNHFGSGHGMSIGSETNGGVSNINVYDLSIDGSLRPTGGSPPIDVNGLRIKSDSSRGGLVQGITYRDVCVRDVDNPIVLNPHYSSATGSSIPHYSNITIQNFHSMSASVPQLVTLDGFDTSNITTVTLDNVIVDNTMSVVAMNASVTLGPGNVNFTPSGTNVVVTKNITGTAAPVDCSAKWVTF